MWDGWWQSYNFAGSELVSFRAVGNARRFVFAELIHGFGYAVPDKDGMIFLEEANVSFQGPIQQAGFSRESRA